MAERDVFLHLGYPKTATTTLQRHLWEPHPEVCFHGAYYPRERNVGTELPRFVDDLFTKDPGYFSQTHPLLVRIENSECEGRRVVSEENILFDCIRPILHGDTIGAGSLEKVLRNLAAAFQNSRTGLRPAVIVTIRKQDDLAVSLFAQSYWRYRKYSGIKNGEQWVRHLCERKPQGESDLFFRYDAVWDLLIELFGRERVLFLVYEELLHDPERFMGKLCDFTAIDTDKAIEQMRNRMENKRSLDDGGVVANRGSLYLSLVALKTKLFGTKRSGLGTIFAFTRKCGGKGKNITFTEEQKRKVLSRFSDSNRRFAGISGIDIARYGYCDVRAH